MGTISTLTNYKKDHNCIICSNITIKSSSKQCNYMYVENYQNIIGKYSRHNQFNQNEMFAICAQNIKR